MKKIAKLVKLVRGKEVLRHSEGMRRLHLGSEKMGMLVEEAVSKGYIRVYREGTITKYRRFYKWTGKELEGEDKEEEIGRLRVGEVIEVTEEYLGKALK